MSKRNQNGKDLANQMIEAMREHHDQYCTMLIEKHFNVETRQPKKDVIGIFVRREYYVKSGGFEWVQDLSHILQRLGEPYPALEGDKNMWTAFSVYRNQNPNMEVTTDEAN